MSFPMATAAATEPPLSLRTGKAIETEEDGPRMVCSNGKPNQGSVSQHREEISPTRGWIETIGEQGEPLIYVDWDGPDDPANPRNWNPKVKWCLSAIGFFLCALGSLSVSAYSITVPSMQEEIGTSRLLVISGLSLFTFLFGAVPLVVAPLSEVYGRREFYFISAFMFSVFHIPQALATNIETLLVGRFLSAVGGSSAIVLVGGTLSDLFINEDRGLPMAMFSLAAFLSTGLGPLLFGYLAQYRGFRPVIWIQFSIAAAFTVLVAVVSRETRESVLLSRKAKKLREETGDERFVCRADEERASVSTILRVSLTRPFRLFITEPTIQAFTASISFAWAALYLLLISVPIVYRDTYGFNIGETGVAFSTFIIGTFAGTAIGFYTNKLYLKNVSTMGPEARMYTGMVGGVLFPVGCWVWAWSTCPSVHWMVPTIGLGILYAGMFLLYLTVFNYLADSYTLYAASASSAMNFWRNTAAAAFPLFTDSLYGKLGVHGAGSLVAGIATLLAIIPFLAFKYGSRLRRKSRYAKEMAALQTKSG